MRESGFGLFRSKVIVSLLASSGALIAACVYDAGQRCGPDQEFSEELNYCVCAKGTAWTENGCQRCGRNEVIGAAGCECRSGYRRVGGRCEEAPEPEPEPEGDGGSSVTDADETDSGPDGLGMSCQNDSDCAGTEAEYCDMLVTMGCLVVGCTLGGSDCPTGYECQDLSGFGGPSEVCVAAVCDPGSSTCPSGFECCPTMLGIAVCLNGGCGE